MSSNTSTIRRAAPVANLPADFARGFLITHSFDPPRHMRLVELVAAPDTPADLTARATAAAHAVLGKTVVFCRDTPGFIADRIAEEGRSGWPKAWGSRRSPPRWTGCRRCWRAGSGRDSIAAGRRSAPRGTAARPPPRRRS